MYNVTFQPTKNESARSSVFLSILGIGRLLSFSHVCTYVTKSRLPAASKANIREAGAVVKESGLFKCCHLEDGELKSQNHLHISGEAEVFIRRERGTE